MPSADPYSLKTNPKMKSEKAIKKRLRSKSALYLLSSLLIVGLTVVAVILIIKNKGEILNITRNVTDYVANETHRLHFKSSPNNKTSTSPRLETDYKRVHINISSPINKSGNVSKDVKHDSHKSLNYVAADQIDNLTFPGTKWCGRGRIAVSYDDLGKFEKTDKCCREHDGCPYFIDAGETNYGLQNTGFFVWSRCDCDQKFHQCLKDVHNLESNLVGFGYFTVFGPQCFKEEYPIVKCKKHEFSTYAMSEKEQNRCVEYELDKKGHKEYQLFDSLFYF